jgi:hypothetical protein
MNNEREFLQGVLAGVLLTLSIASAVWMLTL